MSVGLDAALLVAECGGRVIPAFVNAALEKVPLAGKDWGSKATRDPVELARLWEPYPYAWPAVVGGVGSWLSLDADGGEAVSWLRGWVGSSGVDLSGSWIYRTPGRAGGGLHIQ